MRAALDEFDRRDAHALLIDLGRGAGEAARHHAAHVRPMLAHGGEEDQPLAREHRIDERHVVQVRAAAVGIVEHDHVARLEVVAEVLHGVLDRPGKRHHVRADVLGLGDHLRRGIEEAAGEVLGLVDRDRAGGAEHGRAHLAHDRDQALGQHLERDGIEGTLDADFVHARLRSSTRLPKASSEVLKSGGTSVLAPASSTMAGPSILVVAPSRARS